MSRRSISTAIIVIAALLFAGVLNFGSAEAAQTATVGGNAIRVSPVRYDIKLDPGVTQQIALMVQNMSPVAATYSAHINDFVASGDESGRPNIILDDDEYAPSHSLKRMISPISNFTVPAGETKEVKATIVVPKDAAGGGYYAAVRFAPADDIGGANSLSLSASVGTLVLLTVNGEIKEDMTVEGFDVRKGGVSGSFFLDNKGIEGVVRFNNKGNIQVEPFGKMTLRRFGKIVSQYEINEGEIRGNVLPDSIRKFTESLDKVQPFGKYTLEGSFGYGSSGQLLAAKTTFYVIPMFMILIAVGAVLLLLFLIFVLPRMIRAYNRRVIRRANRRRY